MNLMKITAGIVVAILFGLGSLAAWNSYLPFDQNWFETIQRIAITVSLWAFVIIIYKFDKNPFFMVSYFIIGLLNLISPTVIFIDLSIAVTYFAFAITIYLMVFKHVSKSVN